MVMKARAALEQAPIKLYFAYSTILDRTAFEAWRSEHGYNQFELPEGKMAAALDVNLVFDFPSRFWGGRVAGLTDKPSTAVYGRLFEIPGVDWPIIEHKEGAVTGMCIERTVRVQSTDSIVEAQAFTTKPERVSFAGPVSARFMDALVRGAKSAGLPADYRARLQTLAI